MMPLIRRSLLKSSMIKDEIKRIENATIGGTPQVQQLLESIGSTPLKSGTTLAELIRRPELSYDADPVY